MMDTFPSSAVTTRSTKATSEPSSPSSTSSMPWRKHGGPMPVLGPYSAAHCAITGPGNLKLRNVVRPSVHARQRGAAMLTRQDFLDVIASTPQRQPD